ncbi:hypothetical protein AMATHDRAFT_7260 [Amanita thiersii Skay4041]|uniref:Uncharacterized protein n=1 Tax=Amanita thiersii Skay4041 TaxID=703135 RepID=A0A2A9NGT1_9AGAR|nr:hypothetical protein AMATHDRAFT_7260 [Amanita thiersii Skay4041]
MTRNIDKNRTDDLPDSKNAFDALNEAVLDLFPGATLANRKPQSKLRFTRIPVQHSDGLPMDNGLLYHYIRKHPNFENVRFSLTPRFERSRPLKPGQVARTEFTKTVSNSTAPPPLVKNSSSVRMKIGKTAKYVNDGITQQNSVNLIRIFANNAEERTPPQCINQPATPARKARYATFDALIAKDRI